jgi:hypothetical protein
MDWRIWSERHFVLADVVFLSCFLFDPSRIYNRLCDLSVDTPSNPRVSLLYIRHFGSRLLCLRVLCYERLDPSASSRCAHSQHTMCNRTFSPDALRDAIHLCIFVLCIRPWYQPRISKKPRNAKARGSHRARTSVTSFHCEQQTLAASPPPRDYLQSNGYGQQMIVMPTDFAFKFIRRRSSL